MRIAVRLNRLRLMRWHLILIDALRQQGHAVGMEFREDAEPFPASLRALLKFETMRFGLADTRLSARVEQPVAGTADSECGGDPDLTIDLSTSGVLETPRGRVLRPLYDGVAGDDVLFRILLTGRALVLAIEDNSGIWPIGYPAIEQPSRLAISLDQTVSRLVEGLLRIVPEIVAGGQPPPSASQAERQTGSHGSTLSAVAGFSGRALAQKVSRLWDGAFGETPRWRVAWRMTDADAPPSGAELQIRDFRLLPDDGARFFADPFVLVRDGQFHVFIEELPHDSGIGLISHFTISETGEATAPHPVLQTGTHLSYPFVFEHDGETWMMPESSACGGLDLYRCSRFPDVWTHEAQLLEGRFHDATLFTHDGRLWIAAATDVLQSSTWDALSFFYADTLLGPWTPHAGNPVLVDARFARPAGPLWRSGDDLFRPAQDCGDGYGSKLRLRKILRLTPTEFAEETVGTLCFNPEARIFGPHTICRAGRLEIIDLFARNCDLSNAQSQHTVERIEK